MGAFIKHWTEKLSDTYTKRLVLKEGDRIYFFGTPKLNRNEFKAYLKKLYKDVKVVKDINLANVYILPAYSRDSRLEYASCRGHYVVPEIKGIVHCNNIPESVLETLGMTLLEFYQKYEKPENIMSYYVSIKEEELIKCQDLDKVYHEIALSTLMNQEKASTKERLDEDGKNAIRDMLDTYNYSVVKALLETYNEYDVIKHVAIQALALHLRCDYPQQTHIKYNNFKKEIVDNYPILKRLFDPKNIQTQLKGVTLHQSYTSSVSTTAKMVVTINRFIETINKTLNSDITFEDVIQYVYEFSTEYINTSYINNESVIDNALQISRLFNCKFEDVYKALMGRDLVFHKDIYDLIFTHREAINGLTTGKGGYTRNDVLQVQKDIIALRLFKSDIQSIGKYRGEVINTISQSMIMEAEGDVEVDKVLYLISLFDTHNVLTDRFYKDEVALTASNKQTDMLAWLINRTCQLSELFNKEYGTSNSILIYYLVRFMRSALFKSKEMIEYASTTFANI